MQKLVFDNSASAEDLVNFTVLVHLNSSIIDWNDFQVDGDDIRFIDEDYETYLDYEIETWNHGYDAWIWVEVPQIDSSSAIDHIYMYYDNPLAVNGEDKEGTWDDNYVMIQHMVDETNASILDSTQYDNDGAKLGANEPIETTDGQIDSAQDFDGIDDYVTVSDDPSLQVLSLFTMEMWLKFDEIASTDRDISAKKVGIWNTGTGFEFYYENAGDRFIIVTSSVNHGSSIAINQDKEWHHLVMIINDTTLIFYYDNVDITDDGVIDAIPACTAILTIGRRRNSPLFFNGTIDSVRISNTTRSGDWIEAQYLSMNEEYITYKELSLCESRANIFPLVLIALFVIIGIVVVSRT